MKVAFATDNEKTLSSHFGSAAGFIIYNIRDHKIISEEHRTNRYTGHPRGLKGPEAYDQHHHEAILELLSDCDIVVANVIGKKIFYDLKLAGKEVLLTEETDINFALNSLLGNKLHEYPENLVLAKILYNGG